MPPSPRIKKAPKAQNLKSSGPSANNAPAVMTGEVKVLPYGNNNKLPHEIITALNTSGTAKKCWRKLHSFVQADGFADRKLAEMVVNANSETADAVLSKVSGDISGLKGFGLRVKYSLAGVETYVYHEPFQTIRKLEDGRLLVNPTLGTKKYDKAKDEILHPYNPTKWQNAFEDFDETKEDGQKGQLFYVYEPFSDTPIYPVPDFWTESGKYDIESDAQISKSDNKLLKKALVPAAFVHITNLNTTVKDENGKTELDYATEDVAQMNDPDNLGEIIVTTGATKEEAPIISTFDNSKNLNSFDAKRDTIGRAVCRHFGMPPVLVGFSTPGQLGNNQEILNSISLLQSDVNSDQRLIQRVFKKIFKNGDWTVSTLSPLKVIPPEIWATMTDEEKRNYGGLQPLEAPQNSDAEKTLQALNGLSPLVANKVLGSMEEDEIRALIGLGAKIKPKTPAPDENI